jgi:hypothetical protein|tara:strand:+ start:157 stop:405 length:249 start_codon:yes stop_codon:yes gene_type:complete
LHQKTHLNLESAALYTENSRQPAQSWLDWVTQQGPHQEQTMKNDTITTDQLIWGALFMGWIFGVATMLLLGYNPDNCFVGTQ